jgi:hypothetical protein
MADKKITELNELSSPQANDLIPIVNVTTGETQKVKYSNIASSVDLSSYATISYVDGLIENVDSFTETVLFDTDITLDASKIYIEKNTNSSARSLTIPSANSGNLGNFIFVYKNFNNGYNINCGGGGASSTLTRSTDSVLYISDGSSWRPHLNISNELLLSLTQKEPTITSGTTSQYWRGDKTWQTFPTADPAFNLSVPTGVCEGGILSINADPTKFNISDGFGYIADLYSDPDPANAVITKVVWSGLTAQTVTNLGTSTVSFIYINSAGSIVQSTTEPTEATLRDYIYIGQLGHSNLTSISTAISEPSVAQSPMSQLRDLWGEIGFVNAGNEISANGANLSINKSNGFLTGLGINFENAIKTPNRKNYPLQTLATIRRRTQTGGTGTNTTLDVLNYDLSGTVTTITGTKAQNQRVFLLPSGNIVIQYGQTLYNSLTDAIQGIETETFIKLENVKTGQLIAIISVLSTCTSLQDTNRARIKNVGKFGEVNVGAGSSSVSTLQQAYLNSVDPEINTVNGAVSFKNGGANDTVDVIEVKNIANSQTFSVDGNGDVTGSSITGGTVNANNILRVPVLATDTVTVLNGSLWYNTASNLFKGFVNGIVVTFMTSRMPANTVKTNNTGSTADAVDLALTTETVLGRTASVNSGNISPIPIQTSISAETTLVAGTRTITDSRVTANTIVLISPSNTGTLTQQIRYTKNVGTSIVFTAGGSDTCTFSYTIIF